MLLGGNERNDGKKCMQATVLKVNLEVVSQIHVTNSNGILQTFFLALIPLYKIKTEKCTPPFCAI